MITYAYDLYPRDDPKDGARLVRMVYTGLQGALQSAEYRAEANGTGSGKISVRGDTTAAGFIDPRGLQYVRVVRIDTDTVDGATLSGFDEEVIGGFFLDNGDFSALDEKGTRLLTFGGAGTLSYLAREVLWSRSYFYAADVPIIDSTWHFYDQPSILGGDFLGAVLYRVMQEAGSFASPVVEDDDKPETAIPDASTGPSMGVSNDSAGNAWTVPSGEFKAQIGDNILTIVKRLMESGLYIEMNPDTFVINAWEQVAWPGHTPDSRGQDKTGVAWGLVGGAGTTYIVRFQSPTDGTIPTGNVLSDAKRAVAPFTPRSAILAGDNGTYVVESVASTVPWHGYYASDVQDADTLSHIADSQIGARSDAGDTLRLRMKHGTDAANGEYIPLSDYDQAGVEPSGVVMLNDLVTVHTGTGQWDYNEDTFPVAALTIVLREGGDWDAWADLGSSYTSMAERAFQAKGVATHNHPPNPQLCSRAEYTVDIASDNLIFGVTRLEYGYVSAADALVVLWDTNTDPLTFSVVLAASVQRWFMRVTGGAVAGTHYSNEPASCILTEPAPDTVQQAWEWTGPVDDFNDTIVTIERVAGDFPLPLAQDYQADPGSSGRAKRCDERGEHGHILYTGLDHHDSPAITYDGTASGLAASNVKDAIDELALDSANVGWFNVKDYGATGDGVTDDTSEINTAIAALNTAGGGVLYYPATADFYLVSAGLTAITVPCIVRGDGMTASRVTCSSATANIFTVQSDSVHFRDLKITSSHGTPTAGAAIRVESDGEGGRFENLWLASMWTGIRHETGSIWVIDRSYIEAVRKYGIHISNVAAPDGGDWAIDNSTISAIGNSPDAAIRIDSSGGGKITNLKVNASSAATGFNHGIDLAIAGSDVTSILLVANSSIENVRGDAVHVTQVGTAAYSQVSILGCQVALTDNNSGKAVSIVAEDAGALSDIIIATNLFTTNGTARSAIQLTNADNVTLVGNELSNNFTSLYTNTGSTNVVEVGTGVSDLDDLSDVTITSATEDDDLRFNGSAWINDARKWEVVTDGEDVFAWEGDDLVHEWST